MNGAQTYVPTFTITVGGVKLEHGSTISVQSVTMTESNTMSDSFSFTVRDRHPDPGRFAGGGQLVWMDSDTFKEENEVKIEIGYRGGAAVSFLGLITAVNPTFPQNGTPTLTVRGQGLFKRLLKQSDARSFRDKKDSEIAQEIAQLVDLDCKPDPTNVKYPLVTSETGTYADFLRKRAERIGYEFAVTKKTLLFQKPGYITKPGPNLTLEWGRDLKSFTPTLSTYKKITHVKVRASQTSCGRGKAPVEGSAGPGDERGKLGAKTASQIAEEVASKNEIIAEDHDVTSPQEAKEVAVAKLEASSLEFITGSGACNGNPQLRARAVIQIKGIGARFSGNYYVTSATHTIDSSGYHTTFEVKRNGR